MSYGSEVTPKERIGAQYPIYCAIAVSHKLMDDIHLKDEVN